MSWKVQPSLTRREGIPQPPRGFKPTAKFRRRSAARGRKPLAQVELFIQIHKATPSTIERIREMAAQLIDLRLPGFITHQLAARQTRSRILQRAFDLAREFIGAACDAAEFQTDDFG